MYLNTILASEFWSNILGFLKGLWQQTGIIQGTDWRNYVMLVISFVLFYLAIVKKFEPLLMLPIAFGMFIVNVPGAYGVLFGTKGYIVTDTLSKNEVARGSLEEIAKYFGQNLNDVFTMFKSDEVDTEVKALSLFLTNGFEATISGVEYTFAAGQLSLSSEQVIGNYGLFYYIYKGVDWVIFPPIIFLGIGCMTDFGPLIANPKSMLMGAAAQLGIFITFFGALCILGYTPMESGAIAIIGGADGPTAIYVAKKLAEDLLPAIAISAYSYMALIPVIQKPIMKLLTNDKERRIKMTQLRTVSKLEKIVFPIAVSLVVGLLLPDAMPLLGMLMLGNLLRESGVTQRLSDTAQNGLMNTITIFLGVMVGSKAIGSTFLDFKTLGIILLGLFAFCMGTVGGLLCAKIMNKISGGKINPLIGSAGVSAVPMAARISQDVGREYDPDNHLLMHAMGPNVAGVISSAIAAGVLLAVCPLL